jgi:hypothetical protein
MTVTARLTILVFILLGVLSSPSAAQEGDAEITWETEGGGSLSAASQYAHE